LKQIDKMIKKEWLETDMQANSHNLWEEKLDFIKKNVKIHKGKLLDLGSGNGFFLEHLNSFEGLGVDNDEESIETCRKKGLKIMKADLNKPLKIREKFDLILCLETMEHLVFPQNVIKEAYRLLKNHGTFIASVPYHAFWKNLAITFFDWDRHYSYEDWHIRFFSEKLFRRILNESGFKILKLEKIGRFYPIYKDMIAICKK
jgi:2-polyprenyl-6-hydroxyphenyl methylase/3-demethylubiquinone-9 3-methyltransferase